MTLRRLQPKSQRGCSESGQISQRCALPMRTHPMLCASSHQLGLLDSLAVLGRDYEVHPEDLYEVYPCGMARPFFAKLCLTPVLHLRHPCTHGWQRRRISVSPILTILSIPVDCLTFVTPARCADQPTPPYPVLDGPTTVSGATAGTQGRTPTGGTFHEMSAQCLSLRRTNSPFASGRLAALPYVASEPTLTACGAAPPADHAGARSRAG